ncbi:MAG: sigma 54-interacting transcriptional regulator [Carboxydocellales bacterium]
MNLVEMVKRTEFDWDVLLNCTSSAIVVLDWEQKIVATNNVADKLFPIESGLLGKQVDKIFNFLQLERILASGSSWTEQPVVIGAMRYSLNYVPIIENKQVVGGVFSFGEEALANKETSYEDVLEVLKSVNAIVDLAYDGIIVLDANGTITMVNQSFADFFGVNAQEMIGKHVNQAYTNSNLSKQKETNPKEKDYNPNAKYDLNSIVGESEQIDGLKETVNRVAPRSSNVLIRGESGTGKELFAHAIHSASNRRYGPFIKVNCAAIPENLLESELFGYEEGAFTGARKGGQVGKFELAHKGTIFLDEIGDMSLPMQAKLLRVLQEREIEPLGSYKAKKVDVRIVAATNVNLEAQVRENKFREDLYYRLNVVSIHIPPLRERQDDIDVLINYLVEKYNREFSLNLNGLSPEVRELFLSYEWPGNIRELKNVIERAFNIVTGKYILPSHLPQYLVNAMEANNDKFIAVDKKTISLGVKESIGKQSLNEIMESLEQEVIQQALSISKGNKALAANLLGISRPGLYKKMLKLHMDL